MHVDIVIQDFEPKEAKKVKAPFNHESSDDDDQELDDGQALRYRAGVARLSYLAPDRSDIQFPVKELCRFMSKPTLGDWRRLFRLVKYLQGRREMVTMFP